MRSGLAYVVSLAAGLLAGCTAISVEPLRADQRVERVCIERNPAVIVDDFESIVVAGFERHGVQTEVFEPPVPEECEFILRYTALRSWDLAPYVAHAELSLERNGQEVARAEYHLRGKGGYALTKYRSTRAKMDPVIDEMLAQYPQPPGVE
jgi:hypothetical protein